VTIKVAVELDFSKPTAIAYVCADRKENVQKQLDLVLEAAAREGYQVIEEFQCCTFPKESARDKVFLEAFTYLFNNRQLVQTVFLVNENLLPEDSLSASLLSLARNDLGVDVLYALEDF
jgi:hypothetical protein